MPAMFRPSTRLAVDKIVGGSCGASAGRKVCMIVPATPPAWLDQQLDESSVAVERS